MKVPGVDAGAVGVVTLGIYGLEKEGYPSYSNDKSAYDYHHEGKLIVIDLAMYKAYNEHAHDGL